MTSQDRYQGGAPTSTPNRHAPSGLRGIGIGGGRRVGDRVPGPVPHPDCVNSNCGVAIARAGRTHQPGETPIDHATFECNFAEDVLRRAGLRPTKQRAALAQILFCNGHRHVTAEALHETALRQGVAVSLATIYNTLHQFTKAGLLKDVPVDGSRSYFDTNTNDHHHFFDEDTGEVTDVPHHDLELKKMPEPPEGMEITRIDVVVRIRHRGGEE